MNFLVFNLDYNSCEFVEENNSYNVLQIIIFELIHVVNISIVI